MSVNNLKFIFYCVWMCVIGLAFIFPAQLEGAEHGIYKIGDAIGEIKLFRKSSNFPAAMVVTYLFSLVSGYGLGMVAIFSVDILRKAVKLSFFYGRHRCFLMGGAGLIVSLTMIFMERVPNSSARSTYFLQSISESRFHLALWCSGILLITSSSLIVFFASISALFFDRNSNDQ